jgi:hypothetical protein
MQKITKLEKYVIELDDISLPDGHKTLTFKNLKQFLDEAEFAEQPVLKLDKILYVFCEGNIHVYILKTESEQRYLNKWDLEMVDKTNSSFEERKSNSEDIKKILDKFEG